MADTESVGCGHLRVRVAGFHPEADGEQPDQAENGDEEQRQQPRRRPERTDEGAGQG